MRPILVSILAVLIILVGVLFLVLGTLGFLLTFALFVVQIGDLVPATLVLSLILFLIGLILTISGFGLWKLRMWAWALAIIVLIFALLGQLAEFRLVSFLIEIFLLVYLLAVREHFY